MTSQVLKYSGTLGLCSFGLLLAFACKDDPNPGAAGQAAPVGDAPVADVLPPLMLTDDTPELLLTWVDANGDFHVVQTPKEVPDTGREQVRVVVTTREDGTGRLVYVADLRTPAADGSYPVRTMTRAQWNDIGADRRKVRMEAVAKQVEALAEDGKAKAKAPDSEAPSPDDKAANAKVRAVVYGADWCKPCHDAEAYLQQLGVDVTKKDIEESRAARAEMQQKLMAAGRMGASIPVIDVAGKLLIGFSKGALKSAVEAARKPETL